MSSSARIRPGAAPASDVRRRRQSASRSGLSDSAPCEPSRSRGSSRNLDGFDIVLWKNVTGTVQDKTERPMNSDPKQVFRVHDRMSHVSGEEWGYVLTEQEYENYHLRAGFKRGVATHAPRKNAAWDSGILFHVSPPYEVWPTSIEFQVIEGRTGEIIHYYRQRSEEGESAPGSTRAARFGRGPWKTVLGYGDPTGEVEKPPGMESVRSHCRRRSREASGERQAGERTVGSKAFARSKSCSSPKEQSVFSETSKSRC